MKRFRAAAFLFCLCAVARGAGAAEIDWQPWSDSLFEKAQREHRFVLLDLGAGWCHWCHVMEEITYRDPKVIALIQERYIAVRVDQDARPDLSNRYENYGWPATVVFNADGSELVKRQGYTPPAPMAAMLQAIIDDPSPGPSIVAEPLPEQGGAAGLTPEQRDKLRKMLRDNYDSKNHGWGTVQKFLDWDTIEFCQGEAMRGDQQFERMARETLDAQRQLIDPVWGGVYQYSTEAKFKSEIGYIAFVQPLAGKLNPKPQLDENVAVARTLNLLHHYTGKKLYEEAAQHAVRYLAAPAVGENHGYLVAGILLADQELGAPPLHVTILGKKDDPAARLLFRAATALPANYKRVEWWDDREGAMPNSDVQYPKFEKAAAFICTNRRCSAPIFDPAKILTLTLKK